MKQVKIFIDTDGWTENNLYSVLGMRFKGRKCVYCIFWYHRSGNYLVWSYSDYRQYSKVEGL